MAAGKVEIGAFRTYPPNYKPPDAVASEYQSIPLDKIEVLAVIFVGEISSRWCWWRQQRLDERDDFR